MKLYFYSFGVAGMRENRTQIMVVTDKWFLMIRRYNNSEKDRSEQLRGRLFDGQVSDRKRREKRAREWFLAIVLERESREKKRERESLLTCKRGYVLFYNAARR